MGFDNSVQADWGTALADLRDNVSSVTNFSVKDDSTSGASSLTTGDYFVIESAAPAEEFKIEVDTDGSIILEHGKDWNASNTAWDDQFENDPGNIGNIKSGGSSMTATGRYWMAYADVTDRTGFGFYFQREESDGDDEDIFFGASAIQKAWDYSTAAARESEFTLGYANSIGAEGTQTLSHLSEGGPDANNEYVGRGLVNPDNNFDTYPLVNSVLASNQYTTVGGETTIIGDHDFWVNDISGSETGHKDLIRDDQSNDVYIVLKRQDTPGICLRKDT